MCWVKSYNLLENKPRLPDLFFFFSQSALVDTKHRWHSQLLWDTEALKYVYMKKIVTTASVFQSYFIIIEGLKEGNIWHNTGFISRCSARNICLRKKINRYTWWSKGLFKNDEIYLRETIMFVILPRALKMYDCWVLYLLAKCLALHSMKLEICQNMSKKGWKNHIYCNLL